MGQILVLQHVACETLGTIERALDAAGHRHRYVRPYAGDAIPANLAGVDGMVVMGGPMGVYDTDQFPWLADEMRLVNSAVAAGKPLLGVCLGSQLLAAALDAKVAPSGRHEIGWHEVTLAGTDDPLFAGLPDKFQALHWHGDVFDLPRGATLLARSAMTPHQAFRAGKAAYGLLFHLEVTEQAIETMAATFPDDVRKGGQDPARLRDETKRYLPALDQIGAIVFGRWAALVGG
jgi:GMP synthase (glutamine-hydrolysing)